MEGQRDRQLVVENGAGFVVDLSVCEQDSEIGPDETVLRGEEVQVVVAMAAKALGLGPLGAFW